MAEKGLFSETAERLGMNKRIEQDAYWRGYLDAIKHADAQLKSRGDEPTIRLCRQAVLALVKVQYEPRHVMPKPDWSEAKQP